MKVNETVSVCRHCSGKPAVRELLSARLHTISRAAPQATEQDIGDGFIKGS